MKQEDVEEDNQVKKLGPNAVKMLFRGNHWTFWLFVVQMLERPTDTDPYQVLEPTKRKVRQSLR